MPKKRVFHENDKIVCCTNRFVLDWGYEHTYRGCLDELAREAGMGGLSGIDLEWNIFRKHPLFKDCQESYFSFAKALSHTFGHEDSPDVCLSRHPGTHQNHARAAAIQAVRTHAYRRLLLKMKEGAERKLFFGKILDTPPYFDVLEKRTVHTGFYYSPRVYRTVGSYESDYDGEPGGLTDRKVHVLLWVSPMDGISTEPHLATGCPGAVRKAKEYRYGMGQCYLLATDCIHLKEAKTVERLRGEELKWGSEEAPRKVG